MNHTHKLTNIFASQLLLIALISLFTGLLTSCSSTSAADKKSKHKSSKAKKSHDALDEEESSNKESAQDEHAEKHTAKDGHSEDKKQILNDKSGTEKHSKKDEHHPKETVDKDEIWAGLMKGNKRFVMGKPQTRQLAAARHELAGGQHPKVVILGCADSHVSPELVFDKNLGDLFVVRTAGNIADPGVLGSIEYAIEHLDAKTVVVLGHENCGAVAAAVSGEKMPTSNLQRIVDKIKSAFNGSEACSIGGKSTMECINLNVKQSAKDVLAKSSVIQKATEEGKLKIIRAVYSSRTGAVTRLD